MYPLKVELPDGKGYACANDEAEHILLTAFGYQPAFVVKAQTKAELKAELKAEAEAEAARLAQADDILAV